MPLRRIIFAAALAASAACRTPVPSEPRAEAPERALTQAAQAQARTIEEEIFEFLGQGEVPAASTAAPSGLAPRGPDARRLEAVRESINAWQGKAYEDELLNDESPGGALAREALDAYARKENLKAVLKAQAALGEDPSHETRRVLLATLSRLPRRRNKGGSAGPSVTECPLS